MVLSDIIFDLEQDKPPILLASGGAFSEEPYFPMVINNECYYLYDIDTQTFKSHYVVVTGVPDAAS